MERTSFTLKCNKCGNERELKEGQHRVGGSIQITMLTFVEEDTVGLICSRCDADIIMGDRHARQPE